ncbi:MAG: hypothetical protein ABIS07_05820, partial [Dokdonella sp.]
PALLIIQGTDDTTMTSRFALALHAALGPGYRGGNEPRLRLTLADDMAHQWSDARSLEQVRTSVAAWFDRYLKARPAH